MRTFILLFCSVVFAATPNSVFSQNTKINITKDKSVSIDEVFDLIMDQTDYVFIYEVNLFKGKPKISLKKGKINANELLQKINNEEAFNIEINKDKVILIKKKESIVYSNEKQQLNITGVVTGFDGELLPGVNIIEKGTKNGTATDFDGNFKLTVSSDNAMLQFSYIGYKTTTVALNGRTKINVKLIPDSNELDEVVVSIGYGSSTRKELTGAVSSVNMDELTKVPVGNIAEALQGRSPGLQATTVDGEPGADIILKIRGGSSITADNSPLIIIDGFAGGDISTIDPNDIKSLDILRDAASAAIYGASGANGVILITTKKAKEGKITVNYNGYTGTKSLTNNIEMLNPLEYVYLQYDWIGRTDPENFEEKFGKYEDIEKNYGGRKGIIWQDEVFKNSFIKSHQLSVSGGSEKTSLSLSLSDFDDEGIQINSGYKRNIASLKFNTKISDRINLNGSMYYTKSKVIGGGSSDDNAGGNYSAVMRYRPTIGINGSDDELLSLVRDSFVVDDGLNTFQVSPVISILAHKKERENKTLNLNGAITYKITDDLTSRSAFSRIETNIVTEEYFSEDHNRVVNVTGSPYGSILNKLRLNNQFTQTLNYKVPLSGGHKLNILAGYETLNKRFEDLTTNAAGFANDDFGLSNIGTAISPVINESSRYSTARNSGFGRITYSYLNKYIFNGSFRADGSSVFGKNNRWGYFPAASFAWVVDKEKFMDNIDAVSNLKIRLSFGEVGNDRIGAFSDRYILEATNYTLNNTNVTAFTNEGVANPNLKWETTISRNAAIDLGLFNNRLNLTVDAYQSNTKDLLLAANVPFTTGVSTITQNIGETEAKGVEFTLNTLNIEKPNFSWTTDFNISFGKSIVKKLADGETEFYQKYGRSSYDNYLIKVGEPLGIMVGLETDGLLTADDFDLVNGVLEPKTDGSVVYQTANTAKPGDVKYVDLNEDGQIDENDRKILGSAQPKYFGGMINTFKIHNFDFSVAMNFQVGNDIFNLTDQSLNDGLRYKNKSTDYTRANRYIFFNELGENIENNPEELNRVNAGKTIQSHNSHYQKDQFNDTQVEDGSFLRISNVTLGYSLPKNLVNKIGLSQVRIYSTLTNLHVFTNYSGVDPEVNTSGASVLTPGADKNAYPKTKSYLMGLNLTF